MREIVHSTMFTWISLFESARRTPPIRVQREEDKGRCNRGVTATVLSSLSRRHGSHFIVHAVWRCVDEPSLMFVMCVTDVRVRRVRPHHQRARSPLYSSERKTPVQPGAAQILRQETLQVYKLKLCQHVASSTHLILSWLQTNC